MKNILTLPALDTYFGLWIVGFGFIVILVWIRPISKNRLPFPPGPPGLPILKNLFDIPRKLEHLTYKKWGDQYGDVVHMEVLGNHFIILNSTKAAVELLEKRSSIYADRPYMAMMHDEDL
jgi:hypothetical protein